jgi:hypothetical protein
MQVMPHPSNYDLIFVVCSIVESVTELTAALQALRISAAPHARQSN